MINLTKGSENRVIMTLSEKATSLSTNYVLFKFTSSVGLDVQYFIATAVTVGERYDDVTISATDESGDAFKRIGHYEYVAYEQTNNSNTDPDNAAVVGTLEIGRAYVSGTSAITWTTHTNNETYTTNE